MGRPQQTRPARGIFDRAPFIAFWETTRACDLVCRHCRAQAVPSRSPDELTTEEGRALLDELADMGCPLVVLTGGDPAKRADLPALVRHGAARGLRMALTPSATPLVTDEWIVTLQQAGLSRLAVSLDGATAQVHDGFRRVEGVFERTLAILRHARGLGLSTQVNTTVTPTNLHQLGDIAALLDDLAPTLWGVFFVVPTGRATAEQMLDPQQVEDTLNWLADLSERVRYDIKTTAATHYRRVLLQRKVDRKEIKGLTDGIGRAPRGVNDGQGVVFIAHNGDIFPSGFLPVRCGNVRVEGVTATYREHPDFVALRDPDRLRGKCGACEVRHVCGGSRARAFAVHGDMLAEDPACAYQPARLRGPGAHAPAD